MTQLDVNLDDQGNVFLFTPISRIAKEWVAQHLSLEGWQWMGNSFGIEHRFVGPIVNGMQADGLRVG